MMRAYIRCQKYTQGAGRVIKRMTARPHRSFNLYALSEDLQRSSTFATMELHPNSPNVRGVFYCHVAPKGQSANVATLRSK